MYTERTLWLNSKKENKMMGHHTRLREKTTIYLSDDLRPLRKRRHFFMRALGTRGNTDHKDAQCKTKGHVTRGNFSCNLQRNKRCIASCENNCPCNTPFSQLAMQQNVALQVARKVELNYPLLFATLRDKLLRVTCPAQLAMFFIRHRCVASCRKNCLV